MSNIGKSKKKTSQRTRSSVVKFDSKRIKESDKQKWQIEFYEFLCTLTEAEFELTQKVVNLISHRPSKRTKPCEVIQLVKEV